MGWDKPKDEVGQPRQAKSVGRMGKLGIKGRER